MLNRHISLILTTICLLAGFNSAYSATTPEDTFNEVDSYLQKGGLVYAYVDIEGDLQYLALRGTEMLNALRAIDPNMAQIPPLPLDTFLEHTGFDSIRAIGISSTRRKSGFENRTFIHTNGRPKGLLSVYGTENQPFKVLQMAPAGSDVVAESRMETDVILDIIRNIALSFMGEAGGQLIDGFVNQPIGQSPFTALELLESLKGHTILIVDVDESQTMELPKLGAVPKVEFLVQLESAGSIAGKLAEMLTAANLPNFKVETSGNVITMSGFLPPELGFDFIIQGNSSTGELSLCSSISYLDSCTLEPGDKLGNTPEFLIATNGLPETGLSLTYVSPEVDVLVTTYVDLVMRSSGQDAEAMQGYMDWMVKGFVNDIPVASVLTVEDNGLFVKSNWSASHKRNLATLAYANPVTIGLMAAMAIPAFQKVRETSQQKAITNNLRMLASAAQQYMLEEGVMSVKTENLIGPNAYIYSLEPIIGESYPDVITAQTAEIEAVLPNGETITYRF